MGRLGVVAVMVVLFVVLPFGRQAVELYTDWLWFHEVGFPGVFGTILSTKALLGLAAGAVAFLALYLNVLATRRGLGPRLLDPDAAENLPQLPSWSLVEPLYRRFRLPACLLIAFLLSGNGTALWETVIRFRNAGTFGVTEPLFGRDVGFYVFTYPFLVGVFHFLTLVLSVTLAAVAAVYVLSRGIRLTPTGLVVAPWAKGHLLALGAAFLVVKAWGYSLDAFGLLFSGGGASFGASYADVNATLPALYAMIGLAGLAAVLLLFQMSRPGFLFALIGIGLWLGGGLIGLTAYPSLVQRLRVAPNEIVAERPYIERSIAATNRAYGLDRIQSHPFPAEENLNAAVLRANDTTIKNIRLWEHRPALDSYGQLQEIRPYYKFVDVDNDRYQLDGESRQVMLSVRELSHAHLPSRIWINEHLVYTHGYGAVVGPVNRVTREGLPEFFVKDIPPAVTGSLKITRPEVYYGEVANAYVLVKMRAPELNYPQGDQNVYTTYAGTGGVSIGSVWRRLAFAARFAEFKMLLSDDFTPESRILYHRQVAERVQKIAPFLRVDRDPYPVITDAGRIVWLVDTYTTTDYFPYSHRTAGLGNYIRNPVKATVDAYDGTVALYVVEPDEPMIAAYARAFPGLFQPLVGDARGPARPHPLSAGSLQHPGPHVRAVPHARSPGLLQQGGPVDGSRAEGGGPGHGDGALLHDHAAPRREARGVHPAPPIHSRPARQHDRLAGRALGPAPLRQARPLRVSQGQAGVRPPPGRGANRSGRVHLPAAVALGPGGFPGDPGGPPRDPHRGVAPLRPAALPGGGARPPAGAEARDRRLREPHRDGRDAGGLAPAALRRGRPGGGEGRARDRPARRGRRAGAAVSLRGWRPRRWSTSRGRASGSAGATSRASRMISRSWRRRSGDCRRRAGASTERGAWSTRAGPRRAGAVLAGPSRCALHSGDGRARGGHGVNRMSREDAR